MQIRALDPQADRPAVAAMLTDAQDYYHLWLGRVPGPADVDDVFAAGPPGCDEARSHRLGLWDQDKLVGVAELSFGLPTAADAYLGLMILTPDARGAGHGAVFYAEAEALARAANAPRLYLAVLQANVRGYRFWQRMGFQPTGLFRDDPDTGHRIHRLVKPL